MVKINKTIASLVVALSAISSGCTVVSGNPNVPGNIPLIGKGYFGLVRYENYMPKEDVENNERLYKEFKESQKKRDYSGEIPAIIIRGL